MLLEQLKDCAEYLDRAERYECLGELYRLIVPILENKRGLFIWKNYLTYIFGRFVVLLDLVEIFKTDMILNEIFDGLNALILFCA